MISVYEIPIYKTTLQPAPPDDCRRRLRPLHHRINVTSTLCHTMVKRDADESQLAERNQYARPILYDIRPRRHQPLGHDRSGCAYNTPLSRQRPRDNRTVTPRTLSVLNCIVQKPR